MTVPAVQHFFETPLIARRLVAPVKETVAAAALALAERYTVDVSQPAAPRFSWIADVDEVALGPGERRPLATSPGDFWVAACCLEAGDGAGGLEIEDPRLATTAAGVRGLGVAKEPAVEIIAPRAGELTMFQAFLRHGFANPGAIAQRWVVVALRAKPI